jgi:hypothetical protein
MKPAISGYDIIGDIHGHAEELKLILQKMGYQSREHVWCHPERQVIFVGDFIDRGPEIREALYIVKNMVDTGKALAIMGNHEFNALAFAYHDPLGGHIRKHSIKNMLQHYETIKQFQGYEKEWEDYLAWFENLPLFLELEGLRIVHACWDDAHIAFLKKLNSPVNKEILLRAHDKQDEAYKVFDELLKGKEIKLPNGKFFIDKDGNVRTECRIKWWLNPEGLTMGDYLFHAPAIAMDDKLPQDLLMEGYDTNSPTVFFGHYWLDGELEPCWQAPNICCLDYSVAKGGKLVAWRHFFDQPGSGGSFEMVEAVK